MKFYPPKVSVRLVLSWMLILGLFFELTLRTLTAWKEPRGRFTWMLARNRLKELAERDGYRFFTGKRGQVVNSGSILIEFNNLGYRSNAKEILPKTDDEFRVACFGDSVTLGQYQSVYYNTWPGQIERILNNYPTSKKVEVLNFGMAHYTHTTNLVNLSLIGEYVKPDLVIFLIGPNDFVNLYTKSYSPDGSHDGQWLQPIMDAVWGFHPFSDILNHSRVGALLYGIGCKFILFLHAHSYFTLELSEETLPPRLDIMALHLSTLCSLSKALGARPVLGTYLYDEKNLIKKRGKDFSKVLDGIDKTIRKVAKETGAVLVEANEHMKDHSEYFIDDFHLSAKGGEVYAGFVIGKLKDEGLLPLLSDHPASVGKSTAEKKVIPNG